MGHQSNVCYVGYGTFPDNVRYWLDSCQGFKGESWLHSKNLVNTEKKCILLLEEIETIRRIYIKSVQISGLYSDTAGEEIYDETE